MRSSAFFAHGEKYCHNGGMAFAHEHAIGCWLGFNFAGLFNAFSIDSGDSPRALLVIAGVGGILTIAVIGLALAGAVLAFAGAPSARNILIAAALAGFVTAMPLWVPAGVVIGAAALILGQSTDRRAAVQESRRNLLHTRA